MLVNEHSEIGGIKWDWEKPYETIIACGQLNKIDIQMLSLAFMEYQPL